MKVELTLLGVYAGCACSANITRLQEAIDLISELERERGKFTRICIRHAAAKASLAAREAAISVEFGKCDECENRGLPDQIRERLFRTLKSETREENSAKEGEQYVSKQAHFLRS